MKQLEKMLSGGDLSSIGKSNSIALGIRNQKDFDALFKFLFHADRLIVMRSADVIEKVTINNPQYLAKHKKDIFSLCDIARDKELKWHLALLLPRLKLSHEELEKAWNLLTKWAKNKTNSRIVRVNAIQGLFELLNKRNDLTQDFKSTLLELEKENIPSINARIRLIRKHFT